MSNLLCQEIFIEQCDIYYFKYIAVFVSLIKALTYFDDNAANNNIYIYYLLIELMAIMISEVIQMSDILNYYLCGWD